MATISRGRIFICYRRRDTRDLAGRIGDSLIAHFGEDDIFMDVDAIEPGLDFASEISKAVASCDVLLAVIGDKWLTSTDSAGRRRLDNPADFVRLEIETALQRGIRVIPVLTDDAKLPREDELPESLAGLVRLQAVQLRFDRYRDDISRLISVIKRALGGQAPKKLARTSEHEPTSNSQSTSSEVPGILEVPPSGLGVEGPALARVEPDLIHVVQHDDTILRAAFSPDSRLLATAGNDETARLWEDGQQRHQLLHSGSVNDISFSYDGNFLATVTFADYDIRLWNPQTGLIVHRFTANAPKRVAFSPHSELLAAYPGEHSGRPTYVWNYVDTWRGAVLEPGDSVLDLSFGSDRLLAVACFSTAQIWNIILGREEDTLRHNSQVNSVDFSKEATLLVTASNDGTARIWDSGTGQEYHRLRHSEKVGAALFGPDDSLVATVSGNDAYIWDPKTGYKHRQLQHDESVQQVQFSPNGELLVTSSGNAACIWDPRTGDQYHQLQHNEPVQQVQFSPSGELLVTCSDATAQVWRMQDA
jgi:WD40 repeat protein